jgi:uroporphyrinogen decarboxylase
MAVRTEAWDRFARAVRSPDAGHPIPAALIVDSPWLPGFMEMSHLDYFAFPDVWIEANLFIEERFPSVTFLPGAWVEYGMATEPSAFGCRIVWQDRSPPSIEPVVHDAAEVGRLTAPRPSADGLMPFALNLYRRAEKSLCARGEHVKMVASRGPFAIAAHLRGVTELMVDLKLFPEETRKLIEIATRTTIDWLDAQIRNLPEVEGILVLDDIVGFLSPPDYREFADGALREVFASFPGMLKVYHNDTAIDHIVGDLAETGFDVLNFSHKLDIGALWERIGGKVRLMGNVPPLELLAQGSPQEVRSWARSCVEKTRGGRGLILSAGGGLSPGTSARNIDALAASVASG